MEVWLMPITSFFVATNWLLHATAYLQLLSWK